MSVLLKIDDLPIETRKKILSDLKIKSIPTKKGKNYGGKSDQFDLFEIIDNEYVAVPFAYYFQSFGEFPNNEKTFPKIQSKFQLELFDRQKQIRNEIFTILNETHSIVLSLFTGYGKTFMAIYISCKIGLKTLILDHRIVLTGQWENSIKKACGENVKIQVLTAKNKLDPEADFYIINAINVIKRSREDFKNIGTIILDESHCQVTEKYTRALFNVYPKYFLSLTATPVRTDGKDQVIELTAGPNILFRGLNSPFNVYLYKTGFSPKVEKNDNGDMIWNSVLVSQAFNKQRNELIIDLVRYFVTRNILILVKRKDHAELLLQSLKNYNIDVDTFMGSQKIVNFDCRVLIATYSKGGVGFDMPKLDMLIVAGDVEESWIQYLGRIFRREYHFPLVVDLIDTFRPLKNHSDSRIEIYKNSGAEIKNLNTYFPTFEWWRKQFATDISDYIKATVQHED